MRKLGLFVNMTGKPGGAAGGGGGGGGFSPYMDAYGADIPKAAFALRKVKSGATYAITVRRSSDSATQDIGFNATTGELDTAALLSFVGAGDGYVTRWYDQIAGLNLIQPVATQQPRIVIGGALVTLNGKPTIDFAQNLGLGVGQLLVADLTSVQAAVAPAFHLAFAIETLIAQPSAYPRLAAMQPVYPDGGVGDYTQPLGLYLEVASGGNFALQRAGQSAPYTAGSGVVGKYLINAYRERGTSNAKTAAGWSSFLDSRVWGDFTMTPTMLTVGSTNNTWDGVGFHGRIAEVNLWADDTAGTTANTKASATDMNTRFALGAVIP